MNCNDCIYWSELVAQAIPENNHALQAMCLNLKSTKHGNYTFSSDTCKNVFRGREIVGAVDINAQQGVCEKELIAILNEVDE